MNNSKNPIVKKVINKFTTIQNIAEVFVTGQSAQRGLLISGDAGTGKSHYVKQAFITTNTTNRVDYQKSKTFTAPALYAKLWENRHKGDVLVFDDCSLESLTGESFNKFEVILVLFGPEVGPHSSYLRLFADGGELESLSFVKV